MSTQELLAGIKVLEIAQGIPGPVAGKALRDLGAQVTRIEPPDGDWLAGLLPGEKGGDASYQEFSAGKEIVKLDLATPAGRESLRALVAQTDICIVGERQAKLAKLGLGYETLKQISPQLIYCHISGWGNHGPLADRAASELCMQIAAGLNHYLGVRNGAPVRQGLDLVSVDTGLAAAQAALAALLWREQTGEGQYVETSMIAVAVALMQWNIAAHSGPDKWISRQLTAMDWPPDHGFQCADRRCLIDLRFDGDVWQAFLREIGCNDLAEDPRFATREGVQLVITELPERTARRLSEWKFVDLERLVRDKFNGTIVPMLSVSEVIDHPQINHIGVISAGPDRHINFPMHATLIEGV